MWTLTNKYYLCNAVIIIYTRIKNKVFKIPGNINIQLEMGANDVFAICVC